MRRRLRLDPRWLLVAGVTLAAAMDAVNATALSVARVHVMGGIGASPDETAWLNVAYVAAKLAAFPLGAWIHLRFGAARALTWSTSLAVLAALACGLIDRPEPLLLLRALQGAAGGVLLVSGQATVFEVLPRRRQGVPQAVLALATVVSPSALAPALQGWLAESVSWSSVFLVAAPLGFLALAALHAGLRAAPRQRSGERLDAVGFGLLVLAAGCATYVLQQGSRWNWLDEPMIVGLAVTAAGAALLFLARQQSLQGRGALVDFSVLRHPDYAFAFVVTFVAGFALFGSAYLIPAFAIGVLGFTARDAGLLLLPSAALIALALVAAGALVQFRRVPPLAFVPFGIGLFMTAMWMLSRSTAESSFPDLAPALLVRGLGLGLLFIALVLFAFGGLRRRLCVHGVALFSLGRQLGGLIGAAALETCLDHGSALGRSVLAARLSPGDPAFDAWRTRAGEMLAAQGLADGQVGAAANGVIFRTLDAQAHVLAFDHAFLALAGLFVVAAPVLVALKIVLKKRRAGCAQPHEPRDPPGEPRGSASGRRRLALFHYFTT